MKAVKFCYAIIQIHDLLLIKAIGLMKKMFTIQIIRVVSIMQFLSNARVDIHETWTMQKAASELH